MAKVSKNGDTGANDDTLPPAHSSVHLDMDVTNERDSQPKVAANSSSESRAEPPPRQPTASFLEQHANVRTNFDRQYTGDKADIARAIRDS